MTSYFNLPSWPASTAPSTPVPAFSPAEIAGLHVWLKGSVGVLNASDTAATNGQAVKTWQDQSGGSRHGIQATVANQGLYETASAINGKPAITMDGVSDFLKSTISITTATVTAFFAYRFNTPAIARLSSIVKASNADFNDSQSAILAYYASSTYLEGYRNPNDKSFKSGLSASAYNAIICSQFDSVNHTLYVNSKTGQTPVASAEGVFNAVEFYIGCGRAGPGVPITFAAATFAEVILYNTSLTQVDREAVMDYLNGEYATF